MHSRLIFRNLILFCAHSCQERIPRSSKILPWSYLSSRCAHISHSIVAIHGLNPKNKERHAERTWELDGKIWLRDFLPSQLSQARILLFGYNASVSIQSSSAGVREQAQNLLSRLSIERQVRNDMYCEFMEPHPREIGLRAPTYHFYCP